MQHASKEILEELSKRGYRITSSRKEILDVLAKEHDPVSIQDLAAKVATDDASVYRTVRILCDEGFLEEMMLVGKEAKYALAEGHHHHIVCDECGKVAHIPCETASSFSHLPEGFSTILSHEVVLHGLCKKCS